MEEVRDQLGQLERILREELAYERQDPASSEDREMIESLKAEISRLEVSNQSLSKEVQGLKAEIAKTRAVPAVSTVELEKERMRRVRAEEELSAYRRQSKGNNVENNAKRIAISLARHCVELAQELERVRRGEPLTGTHEATKDALRSVIFPKDSTPKVHAPAQPPKVAVSVPRKGWGVLDDDDDLFSALN